MSHYQKPPELYDGLRLHQNENTGGCSARVLEAGLGETLAQTGLGPGERLAALSLHTAKHIVEMMDGTLDIRSTRAGGAAANLATVENRHLDTGFRQLVGDGSADRPRTDNDHIRAHWPDVT